MGHIEQASRKPDCTFCFPEQSIRPHFAEYGRARIDLVPLVETDFIMVIPDALPVSPDGLHLLMVPKPHSYSFAALSEHADEIGRVLKATEELVGQPLAIFEHGGVKEGGKNQSVYHQHAHLSTTMSPTGEQYDIIRYMEDVLQAEGIAYDLVDTPDASPAVNLQTLFREEGYFYIQQGPRGIMAHDGTEDFPSQLMQRNMSRLLSGRELNWKRIPDTGEFAALAVQRISSLLERCKKI